MPGYNRVILSGVAGPGEVWSVGLSYAGSILVGPQAEMQAWAVGIAAAMSADEQPLMALFLSSAGFLTDVRTEARDPNGALTHAGEAVLADPWEGAAIATKPRQTALVISLLTGLPGRSFRGRIYWPAWAFTNNADMRFDAGNLTTILSEFVELNGQIIAAAEAVDPAVDIQLVVRSRLLDVNTPVVQVAAGNVPDTQRRRRDELIEIYQVASI